MAFEEAALEEASGEVTSEEAASEEAVSEEDSWYCGRCSGYMGLGWD
jgi:hypothetical protein